jgi:ABC-type transporter Mla subunit MlaD
MAAIFQLRRGSGSVSLVDGELYVNKGPDSLQYAVGEREITLAKLDELNTGSLYLKGGISASGDITASNAYFSGDVAISGNLFLGNNSSDNISALGVFTTNLNAGTTNTYNIGSTSSVWANIYANNISASSFTGSLYGMGDPTTFSASVDNRLDRVEASASLYDNAMSGSNRLYVSPSGSDSYDGKDPSTPFRTIKAAVESLGVAEYTNTKRHTIFIGSGEYTEQNPIALPPGVAIVGDTLRTVRLTAANPTKDYFHCHDGNYFYGLRFLNLQNPSFCFSYPCSTATASISAGGVSSIGIVHSMTGYTDGNNQDLGIIIEGPDASGSIATATANVAGGVITQINVVSGGTNYANGEKPHISIPAPLSKRPIIGTSPYIQNCSSITGPFTTDGTLLSLIPGNTNYAALPYNINDVRNSSNAVIGSGVIDEQGAGGGIRIDGNLVHPSSPLESFVADAFTQVNQGGPGHLVINKGYSQFVSCFTTFCTYGFKVANGGFANISNSVIDFGKYGLVSKTYFPQTYNTGSSLETKTSTVSGFVIDENGAGYTGSIAGVTITGGGASVQATAEANVNANGSIDEIVLLTSGSGYTTQPSVTIAVPTGAGAIQATTVSGKALITGVSEILMSLQSGSRGIDISSNMILNGIDYLVTDVAAVSGQANQRRVTTYPAPPSITTGNNVYFHQLSNISTGGLVMEYGGSGVTYNALPKFGGVPIRTREINEFAPGRVFYSTVDNIGNLKIGDFFAVNQLTGEVTIDANSFNLAGLNTIGPFKRNGVAVGVVLQEVSNNTTLLNSQGLYGEDTVPTQFAVKGYVDIRDGRLNNLETTSASLNVSISSLNTYTASLKTAIDVTGGNTRILGNLIVDGTQTSLNTTETFIEDKSITLASGSTSSGIADGAGFNIAGANVSMSWEDSNQRLYFNTNIAALGSISSSTIIGLNGVSVTTYSTSVDSRLSNLQSKSASVDISISTLNTFTSSNENTSLNLYTASANIWSGSIDTKFITLGSYTASVNQTTSSLNEFSASVTSSLLSIYQTTSSLNQTTASLNSFSGNINTRFDNLQTYTTSVDTRFATLGTYTGSVNQTTSSLNSFSASVSQSIRNLNIFSSSYYIDSASFDYRISILDPSNLDNVLLGLNAFTQSANARFTEIGIVTGSLINSASNASTRLTALETETSNLELYTQSVENRFTNLASYTGSTNTSITSLNSFTQSANVRLNNIESFTSSINTTIKSKLDTDGVISGSLQILGNSTIHSGSIGNYQFNSIGVGTAASTITGEIIATGDIVAFYSSDERLKENIQPIQNALTKVEAISGNTYDWKEGFEEIHSHTGHDLGVIAQEIEKVLPEVVINRENGYKAVDYEKIVPLLIEAIKELSAKVKELENK